jgi:hypothetical protein
MASNGTTSNGEVGKVWTADIVSAPMSFGRGAAILIGWMSALRLATNRARTPENSASELAAEDEIQRGLNLLETSRRIDQ